MIEKIVISLVVQESTPANLEKGTVISETYVKICSDNMKNSLENRVVSVPQYVTLITAVTNHPPSLKQCKRRFQLTEKRTNNFTDINDTLLYNFRLLEDTYMRNQWMNNKLDAIDVASECISLYSQAVNKYNKQISNADIVSIATFPSKDHILKYFIDQILGTFQGQEITFKCFSSWIDSIDLEFYSSTLLHRFNVQVPVSHAAKQNIFYYLDVKGTGTININNLRDILLHAIQYLYF